MTTQSSKSHCLLFFPKTNSCSSFLDEKTKQTRNGEFPCLESKQLFHRPLSFQHMSTESSDLSMPSRICFICSVHVLLDICDISSF